MLRGLILISYLLRLTFQWIKAWKCWNTSWGIKSCDVFQWSVSFIFFSFNWAAGILNGQSSCLILIQVLLAYLVMSAQDEVSVVVKCLRLGAADYLVKPLRTNELLNLWTHMWRRRRMVCFCMSWLLSFLHVSSACSLFFYVSCAFLQNLLVQLG